VKVPGWERATVPERKITEYLLSTSHKDGRPKAAFFGAFGFRIEAWEVLAEALRGHVAEHETCGEAASAFGTRYVVEGPLETPNGRRPEVRTVWFLESESDAPRLVTAYPLTRTTP
jgi:hypothetical protein